jgi:hypothetical protein
LVDLFVSMSDRVSNLTIGVYAKRRGFFAEFDNVKQGPAISGVLRRARYVDGFVTRRHQRQERLISTIGEKFCGDQVRAAHCCQVHGVTREVNGLLDHVSSRCLRSKAAAKTYAFSLAVDRSIMSRAAIAAALM